MVSGADVDSSWSCHCGRGNGYREVITTNPCPVARCWIRRTGTLSSSVFFRKVAVHGLHQRLYHFRRGKLG